MKLVNTVSEFDQDITCVKFSAAWCGPCKQIEPFVQSSEQKISKSAFHTS
jgi:hypothetical protein